MTLLFYVNNQTLSLSPTQQNVKVASDSKNYLKVKFIFQTLDWETDKIKYVLFSHGNKTYKKYLGIEDGVEENECFVSPEVIKAGKFFVSVFCENYISTNKVAIPVEDSGYTENITNGQETPAVVSQMRQLEEKLYQYASLCNDILKECQKIQQEIREENK